MTQRTYRILQTLILMGLGFLFFHRIWSGTLFYYINERFFGLALLGGLGFWALAFFFWPRSKHPAGVEAGHDHHSEHSGHFHPDENPAKRFWVLGILTVPLLLGFAVPANPLGAGAVSVKGIDTVSVTGASEEARLTSLSLPNDERTVLDWLRTFNYEADPSVFSGERADVTGFVFRDERLSPDEFLVGRFTLTCCVADAYAIGLVVRWPEADTLSDNVWVRVKGTLDVRDADGREMVLQADSVTRVDAPAQPYLFP